MIRYRQLSIDPPVVLVFGATRGELFENAAFAMYEQMYRIRHVPPTYSRPIVSPGDSYEELLENWLEELRFVGERDDLVWSSFAVDRLEDGGVQGSGSGMPAQTLPAPARLVSGVAKRPSIVQIPDGWWVELGFQLESAD